VCVWCPCLWEKLRVGQSRIYAPYMTVYLDMFLPKIPCIYTVFMYRIYVPYIHRIYMVAARGQNHIYVYIYIYICLCVVLASPRKASPKASSVSTGVARAQHCWY